MPTWSWAPPEGTGIFRLQNRLWTLIRSSSLTVWGWINRPQWSPVFARAVSNFFNPFGVVALPFYYCLKQALHPPNSSGSRLLDSRFGKWLLSSSVSKRLIELGSLDRWNIRSQRLIHLLKMLVKLPTSQPASQYLDLVEISSSSSSFRGDRLIPSLKGQVRRKA